MKTRKITVLPVTASFWNIKNVQSRKNTDKYPLNYSFTYVIFAPVFSENISRPYLIKTFIPVIKRKSVGFFKKCDFPFSYGIISNSVISTELVKYSGVIINILLLFLQRYFFNVGCFTKFS